MTATAYTVHWITDHLAVGHAPMSYDELASIRNEGIDAIINLCGEFCDLHHIEKNYGFMVLYLPVADDNAPELSDMEKALEWLDEAICLGRKVLVHCRLGIGRTGTFVMAHLLRSGCGLKPAEQKLRGIKGIRATPTSYYQWKFLRKYAKKIAKLTAGEHPLKDKRVAPGSE